MSLKWGQAFCGIQSLQRPLHMMIAASMISNLILKSLLVFVLFGSLFQSSIPDGNIPDLTNASHEEVSFPVKNDLKKGSAL